MPSWLEFFRDRSHAPFPHLRLPARFSGVSEHLAALKRLRRQHDPLRAARRDAIQTDATVVEQARGRYEHDAAVAFQHELDKLKLAIQQRVRELDLEIKRHPPRRFPPATEILARVEEATISLFRENREALADRRAAVLTNKRALNAFRRENRVLREPRRPSLITAVVGIIALTLAEAFLNFHYLLPTGAGGTPVEIIVFVFATAAANVFAGVAIGGFGARQLYHIKPSRKLLGVAVLALTLAAALVLHSILANYRFAIDAAHADPRIQGDAALLQRLDEATLNIFENGVFAFRTDVKAIALFAWGMLFHFVAILEGTFLLTDPYPGLGAHDKYYRLAKKHSDAAQQEFTGKVSGIVTRTESLLDAFVADAAQRLRIVKRCVDDAAGLIQQFEREASRLEDALVRMFADYREEYRQVRESMGPVFWQDDDPRLNRELPFEIDHLVETEDKQRASYESVAQSVEDIKTQLTAYKAGLLARVETYLDEIDLESQNEAAALADIIGAGFIRPPEAP
jgi:hypothetical protein